MQIGNVSAAGLEDHNACMAYWWSNRPDENLFMEITRREDIGEDLRAPLSARGGVDTPGYALVSTVEAGDAVIHYDSAAELIVGVSWATGERFNEPIWWASRGSYARRAGVEPQWLPGLRVALADYRALPTPLSLRQIKERRGALLTLRDALQAEHPDQSLYFPWTPYRDSLRTWQTYLAKFPRAALDVLPEVASVIERKDNDVESVYSPIASAERAIASAAGRPPSSHGRGQGFATDQHVKVAVETHAMNAALKHYKMLGDVVDMSRTESYDYRVHINGQVWHIEVKGTTGDPADVLLTPNEVKHAADYPRVALFLLSNVTVTRNGEGQVEASGGDPLVLHPWRLDPGRLVPIGYRYRLPRP